MLHLHIHTKKIQAHVQAHAQGIHLVFKHIIIQLIYLFRFFINNVESLTVYIYTYLITIKVSKLSSMGHPPPPRVTKVVEWLQALIHHLLKGGTTNLVADGAFFNTRC